MMKYLHISYETYDVRLFLATVVLISNYFRHHGHGRQSLLEDAVVKMGFGLTEITVPVIDMMMD